MGPAREAGLQQEVGELIEQALEIDRVGQLGDGLRVRRRAHYLGMSPSAREVATGPAGVMRIEPPPPGSAFSDCRHRRQSVHVSGADLPLCETGKGARGL